MAHAHGRTARVTGENAAMALKLFRSTGYSSILSCPARPGWRCIPRWIVAAVSLWVGFACNVACGAAFRRSAADGAGRRPGAGLGGHPCRGRGLVLSILGWRRTLKPAATLVLCVAALAACGDLGQQLPDRREPVGRAPSHACLPSWASLLRWQVLALLVVLGAGARWLGVEHRMCGACRARAQLRANLAGAFLRTGARLVASGCLAVTRNRCSRGR